MILGMPLPVFTAFHVLISLAAPAAGFPLTAGLLKGRDHKYVTSSFLALTTATSVTGFLFPATQLLPSHAPGIISLMVLAVGGAAMGFLECRGPWRRSTSCAR